MFSPVCLGMSVVRVFAGRVRCVAVWSYSTAVCDVRSTRTSLR